MNNTFEKIITTSSTFFVGLLFCSIKCFGIVGKSFGFFSGFFLAAPLFGGFFSPTVSIFLTGVLLSIKSFLFGYPITGGIPTLIATLAWASHKKSLQNNLSDQFLYFFTQVIIPAFCIILFVTNESVGKGYLYSFYWFIPITIYFCDIIFNQKSIFLCALSTTFIAHAVGSVIWLKVLPLSGSAWLNLIPIVAIERLISAIVMTIVFYGMKKMIENGLDIEIIIKCSGLTKKEIQALKK